MKNNLEKIAIVSMSGIFPGAANLDIFLKNIQNKHNAIVEIPQERWVRLKRDIVSRELSPDKALCSKAGLITDFSFDPYGYNVDYNLLRELDPTHQLVLQAGKDALERCYVNNEIKLKTGVILASISLPTEKSSDFAWDVMNNRPTNASGALGATVVSLPAAILARSLGLFGGCYTLDAACASSLYSVKLACEELWQKNADMMITGGVSRADSLYTQIGFSQLQALSPSGVCTPFDKNADGLIVGEGVGILVLKRLTDAIHCNDDIHGIISGFGLSNDIEGNLVAPASEGQIRALQKAYLSAGWSFDQVQYIECHGSATPVGDNIELSSMINVQNNFTQIKNARKNKCAIGSVKSMTGHLLTAAGATGMIKTLLAMKNKFLPPSLNFTAPPVSSPLDSSDFYVQTEVDDWKKSDKDSTRKAGISAFGFGGINAHILIEEFVKSQKTNFVLPAENFYNNTPVAVIGIGLITGLNNTLDQFKDIINHPSIIRKSDNDSSANDYFIKNMPFKETEFHIPPNQIQDILNNQLIMLKTAKTALTDAGIQIRPSGGELQRVDFGGAIGVEFDFNATDFFLRWKSNNHSDYKPLTATRTLGALGGIVASRVAREFKLGGPCFTVSAGAGSGLKAIEIGVNSLLSGETKTFLAGSVDMVSDIRELDLINNKNKGNQSSVKNEGAAALVLKTLDNAIKDNDKIYGVIKGIGKSSAGELSVERPQNEIIKKAYQLSLKRCLENSKADYQDLTTYELGALNNTDEENLEKESIQEFLNINAISDDSVKYESVKNKFGYACGFSGLLSFISGIASFTQISGNNSQTKDVPKQICIANMTDDGGCSHILIEEYTGQNESYYNDLSKLESKDNEGVGIPDITNLDSIVRASENTSDAHLKFLSLTNENMRAAAQQFNALKASVLTVDVSQNTEVFPENIVKPLFSRDKCLEFAIGKAGNVLGNKFDIVDTYPVRVRLPDEPLMLVDRIMDIEGEMLSLKSGKIVTQHDVKKDAWYLDGGKTPVSISIEAGQADLFLCSYLGIDHKVKGIRSYRLLDAKVTFHRTLPEAGETIEYHIEIDRFLRQGDVYLFFFHYKGYINDQLLISMRDGCAGFFTPEEVKNSGGIILKKDDFKKIEADKYFIPPVKMIKESFNDAQVEALRNRDLESAFGAQFKGIRLSRSMKLPGGRLHLIDRVSDIDPFGGRFGLGSITAQADIQKDHWFLTCHFIDDMVMPGTLMYECCSHALRIYTLRMGWVSEKDDVHYDIIEGLESDLKCRGPVTVETRHAGYYIEIKEVGYQPEPYIIADAHMFSDELRIVLYKNMGIKVKGLTKEEIETLWN